MSDSYDVVLDTSALTTYGFAVAVGELLSIAAEDDFRVAVPVLCAAQAARHGYRDTVRLLLRSHLVDLHAVPATEVELLADLLEQTRGPLDLDSRFDLASAVLLCRQIDAHLMTADPAAHDRVIDGPDLIVIEK